MVDERLFDTIRKGVPGTEMPVASPIDVADDDILQLIAYLKSIGSVAPTDQPIGNVANGERLFTQQCASCHRVAGRGGRLGPDLTRLGVQRSQAAIRHSKTDICTNGGRGLGQIKILERIIKLKC